MQEFIIPGDGLVVKTDQGQPIMELVVRSEGNLLRMFGADGEAKIALAAQGNSGALMIGDPDTAAVMISVTEDVSEIQVMKSGKSIALAIDSELSELKFVNANNAITNKLYVDDNGGQIGLGDQEGNLLMSAGAEERGGVCHIMNKNSDTVVLLQSKEESGNIILSDEEGDIRVMVVSKDNAAIHLADKDGQIVWTTMQ